MAPDQRTRRSGPWALYGVLVSVAAFAACTGEIEPPEGVKGAAPGGGGLPGQGGGSVFAGSSSCPGYVCYDCASGKAVPATCETKKLCPEGYVPDCTPSGGTSGVGGTVGASGTGGKAGAGGASGSAGAIGSAGQADASSGGSAGMSGGSGSAGRDSGSAGSGGTAGGGSGAPADASSG